MARGICFVAPKIEPSDNVVSYTPKIFDCAIGNLALVRENICHQTINQVVKILVTARRIYFFGLGDLAVIARDAANKFIQLKLPVSSHDDLFVQKMLASQANDKDVFFIISGSTQTSKVQELLKSLKKKVQTLLR